MKTYSNFKAAYFAEEYISSYLDLLKAVEEYKLDDKGEEILEFKLPEPNFTRVLQGIKNSKGCNVWTDDWTGFSDIIEGVHCKFKCLEARWPDSKLRRFKGENAL